MGRLQQELKRYAEAEAAYRKAIEIDPNYAWAWAQLGELLQKELKRYPEAEAAYRKAVELKPDSAYYNYLLALFLIHFRRDPEALENVRKYVEKVVSVQNSLETAIRLFVELASHGYAKEALNLLENSPSAKPLEPLVVGLRRFLNQDVKSAIEITEIADDVVRRIKRLQTQGENASSE